MRSGNVRGRYATQLALFSVLTATALGVGFWQLHAFRTAQRQAGAAVAVARPVASAAVPPALPASITARTAEPRAVVMPPSVPLPSARPEASSADSGQARREREAWLSALHDSGKAPATKPWSQVAVTALDKLTRMAGSSEVRFAGVECWNDGCAMRGRYADLGAYWKLRQDLAPAVIEAFPDGVKIITGPEVQPNGEVESFWILNRPGT